jgi:hypothetical protein
VYILVLHLFRYLLSPRINKDTNLWLLEHIAHQIRIKNELAAMAQDPQIQAELSQIQQEFAATDFDGL